MKYHLRRPSFSKPNGFTLVELLVVIGIIAILASVILYAGGAAIKMAKRAKANNMANQLQTSALAYYTEYSIYPIPAGQAAGDFEITDASGQAANWAGMLYGLSGNINPYNGSATAPSSAVPNTRAISFLSLKTSDVDVNNGPLNPIPPSTAYPYFNIAVDAAYTGVLGAGDTSGGSSNWLPAFSPATIGSGSFAGSGTSTAGGGTSTAGVAVWANCTGSPTVVNSNQWVHTY